MIIIIIQLILLALVGLFWRLGGSDDYPKGVRRYGCTGLIMISRLIRQDWFGLISVPLLAAAFTLGYGENSKLMKWLNNKYLVRLVCGLAYSLASVFTFWGNWWLYGFHVVATSLGVMLAGNQKFKFEAKREEVFIGLLVGWRPILA